MKIVFMGTPDFAAGILKALCGAGYAVVLCVTQPDRPVGRKREIKPGPVKEEAERLGIPVYQPARVRNAAAVETIRNYAPDLIVVAAFGQIISKELLDLPKYGCLNVHASLLPAYRGASPIQHAILDGCAETGVTIMRMNEGLDTGDIISQRKVKILPDMTAGALFERLGKTGAALLIDTIPSVEDGTAVYTPQPEKSTTAYAGLIKKEMGRIDWNKSASFIERQIRAMNPWPTAYTTLDGRTLKIWKAEIISLENEPHLQAEPGDMTVPAGGYIAVKAGTGWLALLEVQLAGKKRMSAADFLRGLHPGNSRLE